MIAFIKNFLFSSNTFIFDNIIRDIRKDNIRQVAIPKTSNKVTVRLNHRDHHDAESIFEMIKHIDMEWITIEQIQMFMKNMGFHIQKREIEYALAEIDPNNTFVESNNQISRENFSLIVQHIMDHDAMDDITETTFNVFDRTGKGFITVSDIRQVMHQMSISASDFDLEQMISETNGNSGDFITRADFVRCFNDHEIDN